jgi:hypothetical protein
MNDVKDLLISEEKSRQLRRNLEMGGTSTVRKLVDRDSICA